MPQKLELTMKSYLGDEEVKAGNISVYSYVERELKSIGFDMCDIEDKDFENLIIIDGFLMQLNAIQMVFPFTTTIAKKYTPTLFPMSNN